MSSTASDDTDDLFRRYRRDKRRQDRNALVERHIGFATHVAKRFDRRGVPLEDLRQIALIGLVKAVDRFDPDHGAAFTSFAGRTIEGEIKRHFRDAAWSVRVPRSTKELHLAIRRASDELGQTLGRAPSVDDVATHLEISTDDVVEALAAGVAYTPAPLDPPTSDDGPQESSSRLASDDRGLTTSDDRMVVEDLMGRLPEREQEIVRLRFFDELSQSEIAERVGVSQMHVSRLLRKSFDMMRQAASGYDSS